MAIQQKTFTILPPAPDQCQICARKHAPTDPHDPNSRYYQAAFEQEHGRPPTWADALAHCPPEVKSAWQAMLKNTDCFPTQRRITRKQPHG